ncbi:multisubunit sodium/proton antiporter, MrpC subunit [Geoalkalibacter ferrihydriticus]|uniref:NADH-ubiquinone oxidoreductase n=2 Tax=Geoalkalibacter ferrihydriticus TaxID=392333 RepID=A0A0C2HSH2_9BACT|nr:NADH-quinone oxidoreductase subunit K [Geoalkalibacter ferrihydriticus]KIH75697.1 NADH-ubiquinone oxidoreductase [Geoalkalibacter ferrihydriticus DSM 17813]SDM74195.1 multisubunit sodium/proton antiporter, MrpC subunit [Geoalkalibacter ferrihydriticus]
MSVSLLYAAGGLVLFCLGLNAIFVRVHLLRKILAANVMGSGVFMVFIALAARVPGEGADPVPHAMVLTGIVVAVCFTALAVALAVRIEQLSGRSRLPRKGEEGA